LEGKHLEQKASEAVLCCSVAGDLLNQTCLAAKLHHHKVVPLTAAVVASSVSNLHKILTMDSWTKTGDDKVLSFRQQTGHVFSTLVETVTRWLRHKGTVALGRVLVFIRGISHTAAMSFW
jgi:hypothetical protein